MHACTKHMRQSFSRLSNLVVCLLILFWTRVNALYYESHPLCGHDLTGVISLRNASANPLGTSFGVCGWAGIDASGLEPVTGKCLSCAYTPLDSPSCAAGSILDASEIHNLGSSSECRWLGCLAAACDEDEVEVENAVCGTGVNKKCCKIVPHVRCCRYLPCISRHKPIGSCSILDKDLLPGQSFQSAAYALSESQWPCQLFSFQAQRVCQANRKFHAVGYHDTCTTVPTVRLDSNGCLVLKGYVFYPDNELPVAENFVQEKTFWHLLSESAAALAVADDVATASRCDASEDCVAFSSGNGTRLHRYVPSQDQWISIPARNVCQGFYVKKHPSLACSRLPGYLFLPGVSADLSKKPCKNCADRQKMAMSCNRNDSCTGFGDVHGLMVDTPSLSDLSRFTETPCIGLYLRVISTIPNEVEKLDMLLCGEQSYCLGRVNYTSSLATISGQQGIAIQVDIFDKYTIPSYLSSIDPDAEMWLNERSIPGIVALTITCKAGSSFHGALPPYLMSALPNLKHLTVTGCGINSLLPSVWGESMSLLESLDLSLNILFGTLPMEWGNLNLLHLNLSMNTLVGAIPDSWLKLAKRSHGASLNVAPKVQKNAAENLGMHELRPYPVLDLSFNRLAAPIPHAFLQSSCESLSPLIILDTSIENQVRLDHSPLILLHGNIDLDSWSKSCSGLCTRASEIWEGTANSLCSCDAVMILIGTIWVTFFACTLLLILIWAISSQYGPRITTSEALRSSFLPVQDPHIDEQKLCCKHSESFMVPARAPVLESPLAALPYCTSVLYQLGCYLRLMYFLVDISMDVSVGLSLLHGASLVGGSVVLGLVGVGYASVSLPLCFTLLPNLLGTCLGGLLFGPLVFLTAPFLALPFSAWSGGSSAGKPSNNITLEQYLGMLNITFALVHALLQATTQSILYIWLNVAEYQTMYMSHTLLLASITLSLGNLLFFIHAALHTRTAPWHLIQAANASKPSGPDDLWSTMRNARRRVTRTDSRQNRGPDGPLCRHKDSMLSRSDSSDTWTWYDEWNAGDLESPRENHGSPMSTVELGRSRDYKWDLIMLEQGRMTEQYGRSGPLGWGPPSPVRIAGQVYLSRTLGKSSSVKQYPSLKSHHSEPTASPRSFAHCRMSCSGPEDAAYHSGTKQYPNLETHQSGVLESPASPRSFPYGRMSCSGPEDVALVPSIKQYPSLKTHLGQGLEPLASPRSLPHCHVSYSGPDDLAYEASVKHYPSLKTQQDKAFEPPISSLSCPYCQGPETLAYDSCPASSRSSSDPESTCAQSQQIPTQSMCQATCSIKRGGLRTWTSIPGCFIPSRVEKAPDLAYMPDSK